jgi:phosphoglycerate dehydrogenase-like enzyme
MSELGENGADVVVFREGIHAMPIGIYANALRERLPDFEIALARTPEEERELLSRTPVATGVRFEERLLEHADDLELFACGSAGVDHLPLGALAERDVAVTNASGVHGPNIAEYVLGAILHFVRGFGTARRRKERHEWRHFQARELKGSTVTVVGLGSIGEAIVERLEGFDVETIGVRYSPEKGGPTDEVRGFGEEEFHDALARTEYLVLAAPLTDTTEGLLGSEAFVTLPPEAVVINVGRGPLIETDALVSALQRNHVDGAVLDVTDPEPLPSKHILWRMDNVLLTPHNAGHTPEYYHRFADIVADNLERVAETGSYENLDNQVQ